MRSPGSAPRCWWRPLGVLLAAFLSVGAPGESGAQSSEQLVVRRRLELRAARDAYEAARSAFEVVERQFAAALEEVNRARRSGDTDRLERASALAQDRSVPARDQESRLQETGQALVRAREALIGVLDARMEELVRQMDATPSPQQRAQLNALFGDLRAELQSLEAEAGERVRLEPVVLPEISFDPRDGPDELRSKAELLERHAVITDTVIQSTERQIEQLSARLRRERQQRDFLAAADRFDDRRVPVVTGPPTGARAAVTDSTVAGARPLSLEERIQILRDYVGQLQARREQLLIRAQQFRRNPGAVA
ncbi:MAG: hypothetical protein Q8N53_05955 [Longimicrobiales bacterium]|nr:hypothetical protein [Longimicrobiales bacterium]